MQNLVKAEEEQEDFCFLQNRAAVNHSHGDGLLQNMDFLFAKGGEGDAPFVHAAVAIPQNLVKALFGETVPRFSQHSVFCNK